MNRSGKTSTPLRSTTPTLFHRPSQSSGFSLVEVLLTALLISVGMLGMATLQGRTLAYTSEATQRSTAAMMANDLLETIRAAPADWSSHLQTASAPRAEPRPCAVTPSKPAAQLACWLAEVGALLPSSALLPSGHSYACRSPRPGTCANTGAAIEIQVAWKGNFTECLNTHGQCHVRVRSEI